MKSKVFGRHIQEAAIIYPVISIQTVSVYQQRQNGNKLPEEEIRARATKTAGVTSLMKLHGMGKIPDIKHKKLESNNQTNSDYMTSREIFGNGAGTGMGFTAHKSK